MLVKNLRAFISAHRVAVGVAAATTLALFVAAMAVFKPWLLFVNTTANDTLPMVSATAPAAPPSQQAAPQASTDAQAPSPETEDTQAAPATDSPEQPASQEPVLVASGSFVSHEHTTTGTASVYRLPDGRHQLALADLSTTNGPDVRVWLSAGPVIEGRAGWFTAGDHAHLDVAPIKANRGNQLYDLPEDFSLDGWQSVVLWCEDFSVSFGAATLSQPA